MKKLLPLIMMLALAVIFPAAAIAAQYRVDIDNVDNVDFDVNNVIVTPQPDGNLYLIDMGSERYLRVIAKTGVLLTKVEQEDTYFNETTDITYQVSTLGDGRYYIDLSSSFPEDEIFHITTSAAGDARTATCTVNVDAPERVKLTRNGEAVTLTAGANSVKFNPDSEGLLEIEPVGKPLYRVAKGETVYTTDYRYSVPVADGDVVDIQANYPDVDCTVKFNVTGHGAEDFITGVDVDGRPVFDWKTDGFSVKCGSEVDIYGNLNEYEVLSFTVNGTATMFTNKTPLLITEATELNIEVRKYASFVMTVIVDTPDNVHIYRGHAANGDEFTLQPGENTVEVTRNTPIISLVPAEGFYINTLNISGEEYEPEDLQVAPVRVGQLADNDVLTVTTATINRDLRAMVYLCNLEAAEGYFKLKRADQSVVEELTEGYNELMFYDRDNRFRFETGGPAEAFVYVNDSAIEPEPGGYNYCPTLADGDVVKLFFGTAPARHTVSLSTNVSDPEAFAIVRDHIAPVAADAQTITALDGTHLAVTVKPEAGLTVELDGEAIAPATDGSYAFTVSADHSLSISGPQNSISEINAASAARSDIRDLLGRRLAAPVRGINIIDGRKVIK